MRYDICHIETKPVQGNTWRPWCAHPVNTGLYFTITQEARERGIQCTCGHIVAQGTAENAAALIREYGIDARVVIGGCPEVQS